MGKSILIIAYYFPPLGMGGVQRMAKLAKYLPPLGYDVSVLTVKPIRYPAHDPSLLHELPNSVDIFRSGSSDPARISRFLPLPARAAKRIKPVVKEKSSRFWPDSKIGWKRPALKLVRKLISDRKADVIISSSPPITAHLIAMEMKAQYKIPWIADFRDPWESLNPENLYSSKSLIEKSHRLLRDIIDTADAVTTINDTISRDLSPGAISVVGGYDPDDFEFPVIPAGEKEFAMCYMGTVGPLHPIEPFFEAARIAAANDLEFEKLIRFKIIGANDHEALKSQAAAYRLSDRLDIKGYLPHIEALVEAASSSVSLISVPGDCPGILTGKIFDYLALPVPILASVPANGEIDKIIRATRSGISVESNQIRDLAEAMLQLLRNHRSGRQWEKGDITGFTRQAIAGQFADIIKRISDA
jgi:glycosyltransferase involved in cell wall biosynthesis